MKKSFLLGLGLLGGALAIGGDALACGDKLVIVGRGLRARGARGVKPASILLFADPKGALPAAVEEGHLRKDLEKAGHRVRSVATRAELTTALGTGSYDLVFADLETTPLIETEAKQAASRPTVLPTLFNPSDAQMAEASRKYECVMKAPGQQKDYLAVVSEALALRARQATPARK